MTWTTREIAYLEEHARDGASEIARALGRTEQAVRTQARRYGVSLRMRWLCPRCGLPTYTPLSQKTGWCRACTKVARLRDMEEELAEMEKEALRNAEADRARQRLYSRKNRARGKLGA